MLLLKLRELEPTIVLNSISTVYCSYLILFVLLVCLAVVFLITISYNHTALPGKVALSTYQRGINTTWMALEYWWIRELFNWFITLTDLQKKQMLWWQKHDDCRVISTAYVSFNSSRALQQYHSPTWHEKSQYGCPPFNLTGINWWITPWLRSENQRIPHTVNNLYRCKFAFKPLSSNNYGNYGAMKVVKIRSFVKWVCLG